jgi:hypothetical protein
VAAQSEELAARVGDLEVSKARAEGRAAVAEAAAAGASEGEVAAQLSALRSQVRQQEEELAAAGQAVKVAAAAGALQRQLERARAEAAAAQQLAARLPDVQAEAGRMRAELEQWRVLFKVRLRARRAAQCGKECHKKHLDLPSPKTKLNTTISYKIEFTATPENQLQLTPHHHRPCRR